MSETTSTTPKKPVRKGNSQTEQIIGSAVNDLKKVITAAEAATKNVASLADEAEKQQQIIAQREDQIKELDVTFAETKRQKEVQMALELKENERKTVDSILARQDLVAVNKVDYSKFQSDLAKIESDAKEEAKKATAAAINAMEKDHANKVALLQSTFEKDQATTAAQLANSEQQIKFLQEQVNMWKGALDAERNAGIERAKASSVGTINVTGQK